MNAEKNEGTTCTDQWQDKTSHCAEAQIILEVIRSIEERTKNMNSGKITTHADNKKLRNMTTKEEKKANEYAQEAGAMIGAIIKKLRNIKLTIDVKFTKGHPKNPKSFEHDPVQ